MTFPWTLGADELGLDLATATEHASFAELDGLARAAGTVGGTFATGLQGYAARRAYAVVDGVLHVAPAMFAATEGGWPNPGETRRRQTLDHERAADVAAARDFG